MHSTPQRTFKGLIFDMDGTLTRPLLDFDAMRREIGVGEGDLAHQILAMPAERQAAAWAVIERHEAEALERTELQDGAEALLHRVREAGLRLGLLTRNARRSVDHLCAQYGLVFDSVVTREFPHLKPHPAPVLHILAAWDMAPRDALMIGDYLHDVECGNAAGTATCFFQNPERPFYGEDADFTVHSMAELGRLLIG